MNKPEWVLEQVQLVAYCDGCKNKIYENGIKPTGYARNINTNKIITGHLACLDYYYGVEN